MNDCELIREALEDYYRWLSSENAPERLYGEALAALDRLEECEGKWNLTADALVISSRSVGTLLSDLSDLRELWLFAVTLYEQADKYAVKNRDKCEQLRAQLADKEAEIERLKIKADRHDRLIPVHPKDCDCIMCRE